MSTYNKKYYWSRRATGILVCEKCGKSTKRRAVLGMCKSCYVQDLKRRNPEYADRMRAYNTSYVRQMRARKKERV